MRAGKTVFVAGALPGETVQFIRAQATSPATTRPSCCEVLEPSPRASRRAARISASAAAARCSTWSGTAQLAIKEQQLRENLAAHRQGRRRSDLARAARRDRCGAIAAARGWARASCTKQGRSLVGFRERLSSFVADIERCEVLAPPVGAS